MQTGCPPPAPRPAARTSTRSPSHSPSWPSTPSSSGPRSPTSSSRGRPSSSSLPSSRSSSSTHAATSPTPSPPARRNSSLTVDDEPVRGVLDSLGREDGWTVEHDFLSAPGRRIGTVVHGPSGSYLVETRNRAYRVEHLGRARHHAAWLHGEVGGWVTPVLCLVQRDDRPHRRDGVWIMGVEHLSDWLRARTPPARATLRGVAGRRAGDAWGERRSRPQLAPAPFAPLLPASPARTDGGFSRRRLPSIRPTPPASSRRACGAYDSSLSPSSSRIARMSSVFFLMSARARKMSLTPS